MAFDYTPYQQKQTALDKGLASKLSANTYANFLAKQRGTRNMGKLERAQGMETPRVVSGFTQRGLAGPGVRSGVFQRGLQDLSTRQFDQRQEMQDQLNDELELLKSDRAGYESEYKSSVADLEMQKAAAQAAAAATLTAFKPYMGV